MMKIFIILISLISFNLHSNTPYFGMDEGWNSESDPSILSQNFETRFFLLPTYGRVQSNGNLWSGDYWPLSKGMIDYRWKDDGGILPREMNLALIQQLSLEKINLLSPAEKLDVLNGNYDFPVKNKIRSQIPDKVASWEGICHGWSAATINHPEPTPKVLTNPQGIRVPFDSSDIKALLSYYYANYVDHNGFVGTRCEGETLRRNQNCEQDLNAGAFHIIITNFLGIEKKPLIADLQKYIQVWNHPLLGYEVNLLKEWRGADNFSAPGTTRRVKLRNRLFYLGETRNRPLPVIGSTLQNEKWLDLIYTLEIDQYGLIIGGTWNSMERPDFLWIAGREKSFEGKFYRLNELVEW